MKKESINMGSVYWFIPTPLPLKHYTCANQPHLQIHKESKPLACYSYIVSMIR